MTSHIADVLIPLALDTAYSYAVPEGLALKEGDVVQVPLGTREVVGVVWSLRPGAGGNFKPVTDIVAAPGLSPKLRKFLDWVAWYTLAPKGSALGMGLKLADFDRPETVRVGIRLAGPPPRRMTPTRQRVLVPRPTASSVSSATLRMRPASAPASSTPLSTKELLKLWLFDPSEARRSRILTSA